SRPTSSPGGSWRRAVGASAACRPFPLRLPRSSGRPRRRRHDRSRRPEPAVPRSRTWSRRKRTPPRERWAADVGIVLYRVDERLIHGQVVIGWGSQLKPGRYLVVDDAVAGSDWEQELYVLSLPEGTGAEFVSVAEARTRLPGWKEDA